MAINIQSLLLYAATPHDYQMALGAAAMSGVPHSQVTGNFRTAWNAVAAGNEMVIAVGGAAVNALYYNPCGWTNPAGQPGGHTPFAIVTQMTDQMPGANTFINAAGVTALDTLRISAAVVYYAVHGQKSQAFSSPPAQIQPTETCAGEEAVPCPFSSGSTSTTSASTSSGQTTTSTGTSTGTSSGSGNPSVTPPSTSPQSRTPVPPTSTVPEWGVDSAARVTASFYASVTQVYGKPTFWGRYLTTTSGVSDGLTATEVAYLHSQGVKVLPIYNGFGSATGQSAGQQAAQTAVAAAKNLNVPTGVPLFADIEITYAVDAAFIQAWVDTVANSGYLAGLYGDPVSGSFNQAYCQAVANDSRVSQAIFWSNEREPGVSTRANAPSFNPASPNCSARVLCWQYGENGQAAIGPVDTDLALPELVDMLW